jgi:hypothetical protein
MSNVEIMQKQALYNFVKNVYLISGSFPLRGLYCLGKSMATI